VTVDSTSLARDPLEGRARDLERIAELSGGSVALGHAPFQAQVIVRLDPFAAVELGIASEFQLEHRDDLRAIRLELSDGPLLLPTTPNTHWPRDSGTALWLGPDEWLVLDNGDAELISALRAALESVHHSVVDVSASRVVFVLTGEARSELLAAGCALDLHPGAWRSDKCAQTLLARIPVLLGETSAFTVVLVRSSFADYLVDWFLEHAAP
jgi:sarcosine oxidase subunit gamma